LPLGSLSQSFMAEHAFGSSALSGRSGWGVLAGVTVVSLGAIFPIALSNERGASAGALVVPRVRSVEVDVLHTANLVAVQGADLAGESARLAVDGRDDTAWTGRPGEAQWRLSASFARPLHVGLLRAHFGQWSTIGVPTEYHWEVSPPVSKGAGCDVSSTDGELGWTPIDNASQAGWEAGPWVAQTTRRSWFVDVDACGLRLVIDRTNAGPPVVSELHAIESARDLLRDAEAHDDGAWPGFSADGAIDGSYEARWAGAAGRSQWTLRVDLREPRAIDRVRLVLGFDATSVPRKGSGRSYAIAWAPVRYSLEASEDGTRFVPIAAEPLRGDGSILPLRRRLLTLPKPQTIRALRLVMTGATGASGVPEAGAVPVVREIAAYGADDPQPVLAPPWILSINANPSAETHAAPGGEWANDVYHAKFLQGRFAKLLPSVRPDDLYARLLGPHGELLEAPPTDDAGAALESIEGDDPVLDTQLLAQSSPPPIAVLSGSNDWDYSPLTGPDPDGPLRWHWDPLPDARSGGMGQLGPAVRGRVAPFMGFCGGAQILALLEAGGSQAPSPDEDRRLIDRVLRRTSGHLIRGFAPPVDVERAWPGDPHPERAKIRFAPQDPLFADIAGPRRRSTTQSLPESHADVVRPDAFLPGGPLQRLQVLASSAFCAPGVVAAGPHDGLFPNPSGPGWCDAVPEAFRSRDPAWPVIGAQFHAEQSDFASPAQDDPPESVADPRLFLAGAYEQIVDAYQRLSP
jgi:hypothetical protein